MSGDLPDEAGELARDGDSDGRAALAAGGVEVRPALMESQLRTSGRFDCRWGLALLSSSQYE